jgi:hypothetical protein
LANGNWKYLPLAQFAEIVLMNIQLLDIGVREKVFKELDASGRDFPQGRLCNQAKILLPLVIGILLQTTSPGGSNYLLIRRKVSCFQLI